MRYVIEFAYKGTAYAGWQIQPNAVSIQEVLDKALTVILRTEIRTVGAGRTDTGVHASQMFAHFDFDGSLPERFVYRLNGILPEDIAVKGVFEPVNLKFHTRFDATMRAYIYRINRLKDPFVSDISVQLTHPLDQQAMQAAAAMLFDYTDFASFCKANGGQKTTLCTITRSEWHFNNDDISYHVAANRFLRGMVRALVGTMLLVGKGQLSPDNFRKIIEATDRTQAGPNAGPKGLMLVEVAYPDGALKRIEP